MKTKLFVLVFFCFGVGLWLNAQSSVNVVHLKNGSVLKGVIIEQIPNESLKLRLYDGSVFVFRADEIEKITLEEAVQIEVKEQKAVEPAKTPVVVPETKPVETPVVKEVPKPLVFKSNAIYQNNVKLTPAQISSVMSKSPAAMQSFKRAEGFAIVSQVSDVAFWIFGGVGVLFAIQKKPDSALALPVIGMGTCFVSKIVFSIAARNKIKNAVEVYNVDMKATSYNDRYILRLELADSGPGFKVTF